MNVLYFNPGDIVTLKHTKLLANIPVMLVTRVVRDEHGAIKGIECNWFSTSQEWVGGVFNFKDLILV